MYTACHSSVRTLAAATRNGILHNRVPAIWFFTQIARSLPEARNSEYLLSLASDLGRVPEARGFCNLMAHHQSGVSIEGFTDMAIEDMQQIAGGRHDNDDVDYRAIELMPTRDEVREIV